MICCGGVKLDAGYSAYFPHKLGCEPWVSIADDFCGETEVCEHVLDVERSHSFCVDLFLAWDEQGCFGAIVIGYGEYGIVSLRHWQLNDEVQCNGFEGECFRPWVDGLQRRLCGTVVDFHALAFCASLDVFGNLLSHFWPPIQTFEELYCFANPGVTIYRGVVTLLDQFSLPFVCARDDSSLVLVPDA